MSIIMHYIDIKATIHKRGMTITGIAKAWSVTQGAVSKVIRGQMHSRRIEAKIAELLECSTHDLWPDRYPKPEDLE